MITMKLSSCCRLCVEPSSPKANVLKLQRVSCKEIFMATKCFKQNFQETSVAPWVTPQSVAFFKRNEASRYFQSQTAKAITGNKLWSHKDAFLGCEKLISSNGSMGSLSHQWLKWSPVDPTSAGVKRSPRTSCKVSWRFTGCHSYPLLCSQKKHTTSIYIYINTHIYIYIYDVYINQYNFAYKNHQISFKKHHVSPTS